MSLRTSLKRFLIVAVLAIVALVVVGCTNNKEAQAFADKIHLYEIDEIKGTFPLPKYVLGNKETSVVWTSDKPNVVAVEEFPDWDKSFSSELYYKAKVVLPTDAEAKVKLTAEVTFGKQKATKEFDLTVVQDNYVGKTIAEAKQADLKAKVKVEGVVIFVVEGGGYVIKDDSGQMYVYKGKDVKPGDKMVVRGEIGNYNKMPQLVFESQEQVDSVTIDLATLATTMNVKDIPNHDNKDLDFYSKLLKVNGLVKKNEDSNLPYKLVNPTNAEEFVLINKYSSPESIKTLAANIDKYVEIYAVVYDNRNGTFNLVVPDTFTGTDYSFTDQQKADMSLTELKEKWADMLVTEDVVFDAKVDKYNATVVWSSSNTDVLSNDGVVTLPETDTKVTLTITVTAPDKATATGTVEVTVKKMAPAKINTLIELTPNKAADPKVPVLFEGKVIGHQFKGYWVADETGAVLIWTNKAASTEDPFPAIGSVVSVKGELTTYGEANSFTVQVAPLDVKVLDVAAPNPIAPIALTFDQMFGLGVDSHAKAKEAGKTYYGKLVTITGKVTGKGNFWKIVSETNPDQFFRLNNLGTNAGLTADEVVTITLMVREIYFIDDASDYHDYYKGTFGGIFFAGEGVIVPKA